MTIHIPLVPPEASNTEASSAYTGAGLYIVEVRRGTKDPGSVLGKGWQHRSTNDPKDAFARFAGTNHDIGLHCGRSGLIVFDVDNPDKLPELLRRHLASAPFQSTRPDVPGRGHYFMAMPAGRQFGNGVPKEIATGWGEIRGANGIVMLAPSFHADGGQYRWANT